MKILFFLFFFLLISSSSGVPIFDDVCDMEISDSGYNHTNVGHHKPDTQESQKGHIVAWIDIVGFEHMIEKMMDVDIFK